MTLPWSFILCSCGVLWKFALALFLSFPSHHFIVIHTFCTCIIIIIPSLSPFAMRSYFHPLAGSSLFLAFTHPIDSKSFASFSHIISKPPSIVVNEEKTLYIITFCCRFYTFSFVFVAQWKRKNKCILVRPVRILRHPFWNTYFRIHIEYFRLFCSSESSLSLSPSVYLFMLLLWCVLFIYFL